MSVEYCFECNVMGPTSACRHCKRGSFCSAACQKQNKTHTLCGAAADNVVAVSAEWVFPAVRPVCARRDVDVIGFNARAHVDNGMACLRDAKIRAKRGDRKGACALIEAAMCVAIAMPLDDLQQLTNVCRRYDLWTSAVKVAERVCLLRACTV
jgi:hypothetical protein